MAISRCLLNDDDDDDDDDDVLVLDKPEKKRKRKRGNAILFGWAGSEERSLLRYVRMYNEEFMFDVLFRCTSFNVPLPWSEAGKRVSQSIMEEYDCIDAADEKYPLFIHVFSNGGLFHFLSLLINESNFISSNCKGLIIDSAPAKLTAISAARAFTANFRQSKSIFISFFFANALFFLIYVMAKCFYFFLTLAKLVTRQENITERTVALHLLYSNTVMHQMKTLYIYSTEDKISDWRYIEEIARKQRQHHINGESQVICKKFTDTQHVDHLKYHKQEYVSQIMEFINH